MQAQNELSGKAIQFLIEIAEKGVSNTIDEAEGCFFVMSSEGYEWVRLHFKDKPYKDYWNPDKENSEKERLEYLKMVDDLLKCGYVRLESIDKGFKTYRITPKGRRTVGLIL